MSRLSRMSRVAALLAALGCIAACGDEPDTILVLAAASTIDALEAAVLDFNADGGAVVEVSFGPTPLLARQIEEGAPADILLSASVDWADYVEARVHVDERVVLVGNRLAVVAPAGTAPRTLAELAADPSIRRVAIADPTSVPVGIYAEQALRNAGVWDLIAGRLIPALDARAALSLVADGETDAGLVYATDAAASPAVTVVTSIDPGLHDPVEYPLLLLGEARVEARRFFEFLQTARGRTHFVRRGFSEPHPGSP